MMLAALAVIKVGFLISFGPTIMPDSNGYTEFADFMLRGQLTGSGLTEGDFPATLFRMAGYPTIIAAAKIAAGNNALWLVAFIQIAVSLIATFFVFRLARAFALGTGLALLVAVAQATSLQLALDQVIITDSLNASALTIAICFLAGAVLNQHLNIFAALGAGLAISAAFMLREATLFLAVGLIPLAFTAAFVEWLSDDSVTKERKSLWHGAIKLACIIFPLLIAQQAYREWNRSRVGVPLITTGAQTAVLSALVDAARDEPAIFSNNTPLDQVARTTLRTFDFTEVREINKRLYSGYGHSAIQMA
ncbi:MAG: hypothetical protein HY659_05230, partial [Rhizobiales bacterium]|nr:hypothetical protein [Hyphomicrobiales bacterium]